MNVKHFGIIFFVVFFICSTAFAGRSLNAQLMDAAEQGNVMKIKSLVEQGADINYKNSYKRTPLHKACAKGRFVAAKYFIENGADVEARTDDGSTPLMFAASYNKFAVVKLLVEYGADVNLVRRGGYSALHDAKNNKNNEALVKYLIENGAK